MVTKFLQNSANVSRKLFAILSGIALLTLAGCKLDPLKIDPCFVWKGGVTCYAVPLNQPDKPEYDRLIHSGDVCVTLDEYAALQKSFRELLRRCGDACD